VALIARRPGNNRPRSSMMIEMVNKTLAVVQARITIIDAELLLPRFV
jgi:hypothetical protein